jgi:predicted RNase H-like HicB family nuclease
VCFGKQEAPDEMGFMTCATRAFADEKTKTSRASEMKTSARYAKIVEWSDEDNCYIGSAPGLILGGCHGDDEQAVFEELCQVVEEAIRTYEAEGKALPAATSGRDFVNRMQGVA